MATYLLFSDSKSAYKHRSNWGGTLCASTTGVFHWFKATVSFQKIAASPHIRGQRVQFV